MLSKDEPDRTGVGSDTVGLSGVLGHRLVNLSDNVESDRSGEDGGEGEGSRGLSGLGEDADGGSAGGPQGKGRDVSQSAICDSVRQATYAAILADKSDLRGGG